MMKFKRYRLFNWLKSEKAMADYSRWKDDPVTNIIIDGLRTLNEARLISPGAIDGKLDPLEAVQLNAFRAGRESIISMIENLDDFIAQGNQGDELDSTENLVRYLVENERYSEAEARRMVNNEENGAL